jgi:hypothetical protein
VPILLFRLLLLSAGCISSWAANPSFEIKGFINQYCYPCHGGEKVKGQVDFSFLQSDTHLESQFELWETAAALIAEGEMPPEDANQPTVEESTAFAHWYQVKFVDSVEAHPGFFKPRRLSAEEYRNTLRSLFGFDLEVQIMEAQQTVVERSLVMKLLPTDPPGLSGFTNDTHGNPLTTLIWNHYSYLTDTALDRWLSDQNVADFAHINQSSKEHSANPNTVETLLRTFLPRAFRRPLEQTDLDIRLERLKSSPNPYEALKHEMKTALMSPAFLYRGFLMNRKSGLQQPVDAYEYAERMSFFLWGNMPDEALTHLAGDESLLNESVVEQQLDRMLKSPKSRYLAESFASQWFSFGEIEEAVGSVPVRVALRSQALDFVHYLFTENRLLMELIDSDVSFVSPLIAKHYGKDRKQLKPYRKQKGIELEIVPTQRIQLEHTQERGGLLTMPGILAMNRGPVIRGTWMLERILGEHLPDPPMDVGQVPPQQPGENLSFRQRFELHRSQATCALCHDKIDPLGFAAEGFDQQGGYVLVGQKALPNGEVQYVNKRGEVVDTSGIMPNGTGFDGFDSLKNVLKTEYRSQIIQNIVEKTLSFALCRSLELYDRPAVEAIVSTLEKTDGTYRDLLLMILQSLPFRETIVKAESL